DVYKRQLGTLSQRLEIAVMRVNDRLSALALRDAEEGRPGQVEKRHLTGLLIYWLFFQLFIFVGIVLGTLLLEALYGVLNPAWARALSMLYLFIPVVALAALFNAVRSKRDIPLFSLVFFATIVVLNVFFR
ncbi:MAG: PTS sugar transporter subunit IIC, partial [Syntrophales bacterium]|nr:PTS sugar transporter subunit IIC [Syntrophales bacterium]